MRQIVQSVQGAFSAINPIEFSKHLAIFFIITHFHNTFNSPFLVMFLVIVASVGLLFTPVRTSFFFWLLLTGLFWAAIFLSWQLVDNHIYLWGYWLMAITLSIRSKSPNKSLKISAQSLIAGCMVFAVFQKINLNYLNGDFFYFQLISDTRFSFIGTLFQFDLAGVVSENKSLIRSFMSNATPIQVNPGPHILHPISQFMTWYTLIIESILAMVFLLPRRFAYRAQHWVMLLFLSTYFLLPIKGFAFTLLSLSFTLIRNKESSLMAIYILFLMYIFSFSSIVVEHFF